MFPILRCTFGTMSELINKIKTYIAVDHALEEALAQRFQKRELNKKDQFIREGQQHVSLAFVQSGILRCYNVRESRDTTNDFFFENTFVTDYSSFLNLQPARQNFEAIEDTILLTVSREDLFALTEKFPELRLWGTKMAESLFSQSLDSHAITKSESPEERYNRILIERPEIINRVPLHYVASYLAITQVHLSRIRNKRT